MSRALGQASRRLRPALLVLPVVACALALGRPAGLARSATGDPVIAAAGDIACPSGAAEVRGGKGTAGACHQRLTSDLLVDAGLTAVLTLGDNQYEDGALDDFNASYDPTWGRVKTITNPAPGNHDYHTSGASGYYRYFGRAARDAARGYYSYDIGAWHLIALNSNCSDVGGCGAGSPQEQWLKADLVEHPATCTLAYWHHPRFSSGKHGAARDMSAFWDDLYTAGADIVLSGHDHDYERFAPQNPSGAADRSGIREFIVGTGGKGLRPFTSVQPNSEARDAVTFGVLEMTLHASGYDWRFLPDAAGTFTDSGSDACTEGTRSRLG